MSTKNTKESIPDSYVSPETLSLLKSRDPAYLKSLFSEVNPYLFRVCLANSIYNENADDVIHQTWETFFVNLEKFEGRSQVRTFLCGILFNKIREHRRLMGRTDFEDDSENVLNHAFTAQGWWKTSPTSPDKLIEQRQSGDLIKECLDGLSEQQKTAFLLKEVEEESSHEICNILGVSVSNLGVLLFRAKDKLRKCLEGKLNAETL